MKGSSNWELFSLICLLKKAWKMLWDFTVDWVGWENKSITSQRTFVDPSPSGLTSPGWLTPLLSGWVNSSHLEEARWFSKTEEKSKLHSRSINKQTSQCYPTLDILIRLKEINPSSVNVLIFPDTHKQGFAFYATHVAICTECGNNTLVFIF